MAFLFFVFFGQKGAGGVLGSAGMKRLCTERKSTVSWDNKTLHKRLSWHDAVRWTRSEIFFFTLSIKRRMLPLILRLDDEFNNDVDPLSRSSKQTQSEEDVGAWHDFPLCVTIVQHQSLLHLWVSNKLLLTEPATQQSTAHWKECRWCHQCFSEKLKNFKPSKRPPKKGGVLGKRDAGRCTFSLRGHLRLQTLFPLWEQLKKRCWRWPSRFLKLSTEIKLFNSHTRSQITAVWSKLQLKNKKWFGLVRPCFLILEKSSLREQCDLLSVKSLHETYFVDSFLQLFFYYCFAFMIYGLHTSASVLFILRGEDFITTF